MLSDCEPGDLVVLVWPAGSGPYSRGPYGDYALAGQEVFVVYGGAKGGNTRGPKKHQTVPDAAFVHVADGETGQPIVAISAWRVVPNVEVIEVVETRAQRQPYCRVQSMHDDGQSTDPLSS